MLSSTLRRNSRNRALHQFQERLLHTLTAHIARDGRIIRLARNFVDFVDVDDTALRPFNIIVRRLKQFQDDVFNIFANITRFRQRRCIGHGERHVQYACERLRQQRLTAARWTDQHDVRFCELNAIRAARVGQTFIVIVHRHRQDPLRIFLPDDIIVEDVANFLWCGHTLFGFETRGFVFLADNVHAEFNAFITDEHSRTSNQLLHLMLALTAKRTIQRVL